MGKRSLCFVVYKGMKNKMKQNNEKGFSYIDVMVAIVILMVGVLAMTSALTANLVRTYSLNEQITAKQIASSTLESVFSARDIARPGVLNSWDTVRNVQTNTLPPDEANGIFLTDWTPVRTNGGADGVFGTADDACAAGSTCAGNTGNPEIPNFERQIEITDINGIGFTTVKERRIVITIRYRVKQIVFQETITSIIADFH
jgi:type II secretory pathway pseudopilin PulG